MIINKIQRVIIIIIIINIIIIIIIITERFSERILEIN